MDERGMTQVDFANRAGRTPKFVNEVINGKAPITPQVALEFQRVLGIPGSFWNNRQRGYDAFLAAEKEKQTLAEKLEWAKNFPYAAMAKRKWVPETREKLSRLSNILDFFGVANPDAWTDVWGNLKVAYRRSATLSVDEFALAAWLQAGEFIARSIDCEPFDKSKFIDALKEARKLTVTSPEVFVAELQRICASAGVAVAFVPELPKTASGATRWLSQYKALLQLSLRYKTDDQLWFTFFHEAAHILHHQKKRIFIEDGASENEQELEANRFAADCLIPPVEYKRFLSRRRSNNISKDSIRQFSTDIGIAPGIVVGRLQYDKRLMPSHCNDLKRRLRWV